MMRASAAVAKVLPENPDNFSILTYNLKGCNVHLAGLEVLLNLQAFPLPLYVSTNATKPP